MKGPRFFSVEQKARLVGRLEAGERACDLAEETGVLRKSLYQWREAYRTMGLAGFNRKRGRKPGGRAASAAAGPSAARPPDELTLAKARIAELERLIGRQQADLDFFREALRSWEARKPKSGAPISSRSSKD